MSGVIDIQGGTTPGTRDLPYQPGDHDLMAHWVNNNDAMRALVNGTPCTAFCGKTWVPTR